MAGAEGAADLHGAAPAASRRIAIVTHRPEWKEHFAALRPLLAGAAPAGAPIHHIGSTAVPGLAAKDVIDVQITVGSLDDVVDAAFERAGFRATGAVADHCPPALDLPAAELRKRFFRREPSAEHSCAVHVHVREAGRFNQRYALLCRDYLRASPEAAAAYALIKHRLAGLFPNDAGSYYAIKDPVFDVIMAGAEIWARSIGWGDPPGD